MGNELFDIVNPTYLRLLHDIFSDRNNCASAILDACAQPITSESNHCSFCREVRRTESGLNICRESDLTGMRLAKEKFEQTNRPEPIFYTCEYGLVDVCTPIVLDGKITGFLMAGQFCCAPSKSKAPDEHGTEYGGKLPKEESPKDMFGRLATNHSPKLDRLLADARKKEDSPVNEGILRELFKEVPIFDVEQFRTFCNELTDLMNLLIAFIAKLRSGQKPELAHRFMQGAIRIERVEDLYELMVTELPSLFDAVGASIFVVHHDDHEGDRLVLQKTSFPDLKPYEKTAYYDKGEGLTGWVWANERCLRIKNLQNTAELDLYKDTYLKWERKHDDSKHHGSFLAVPMFNHTGEVLGVLRLPHKKADAPFTSDDVIFLRFLADHLSEVIECQAAKDVIQQATGRAGLANAAARLLDAHSPKEILEAGLTSSAQLFGAAGKMHLMNTLLPGGMKWRIEDAQGDLDFPGRWKHRKFSIYQGLTGKVLRMAMATKSNAGDIKYDLKKALEKEEYVDVVSNAQSGMVAPILWDKRVYGVIAVASDKQYEFTREKDLRILESLTVLIGIALHNYERRRSKIIKALLYLVQFARFLWSRAPTKPQAVGDQV